MPKQRAIINCEKCLEVISKSDLNKMVLNTEAHEARNKAMKSLEHIQDQEILANKQDNFGFSTDEIVPSTKKYTEAETALNICLNCNYQKPSIKEFYDKL